MNYHRTRPPKRTQRKSNESAGSAAKHLLKLSGHPETIEEAIYVIAKRYLEGVNCPPTDLATVAARAKVTQIIADDLPVSGELRREGRQLTIVYSNSLTETRRRFTIAHEFAHAVFEDTMARPVRTGEELERLCDMLASEILMPQDLFASLTSNEPSLENLLELAQTFKTSLSATGIRYAKLKKVSVFYIDHETVTWGSGIVRKGPVNALHSGLRLALTQPKTCQRWIDSVLLDHAIWTGEWKLEYQAFQGGTRALCLLQPMRENLTMF